MSSFLSLFQLCVNFVTYDFNRQDFDQLIQTYFEDETICPFTRFLRLKKKTKFGHYKPSTDEKKNKINDIKGFLKIDKVHFEPVEIEHDVEQFSEYEFIRNTISTSNKKRLTNCRCSYEDLNDFSECKWCTLECCSQRTLARYNENSGPYEYLIQENKKVQTKKNQSQDQLLKDAQEYMDNILVKKILKEEAIVKYAEKNPQWITQNPNNI
ncbi:26409_t:CDS:2, partial [Dentiscutata erythropus]